MIRSIIFTTILFLLLAACTVSEPDLQTPETAVPTAENPTRPLTETEPPLPQTALGIITNSQEGFRLSSQIVDPLTLEDLPDYAPVDFGHHNTYALSPDGRTLALINWASGYNANGKLHFIDLQTWQVHPTELTFDTYVYPLYFGLDGRSLFWTQPIGTDPAHGIPFAYELHRYDMDDDKVTAVVSLPESFTPWEIKLVSAGTQMALYGATSDIPVEVDAVPRLLLVDLLTEKITADIPLLGVTAGQYRLQNTTNKTPYRMARPGLAWDLAQNFLYIIHAAEDKATVVDLTAAKVIEQVDIQPRQSALERLLSWGVQVAEAKVVPGTDKQAILSADGRLLYAVGLYRELKPVEDEEYGWIWHETPLGLQVINTDDLTEAQVLDLPVTNMALSPDGKWLLLTGAYDETRTEEGLVRVKHGLYLVESENLTVTAHLLPEAEVFLQGFSADGRYAYISTSASDWLEDHYGNWRTTMHVLDLQSGQIIAEREFPGSFIELIR